MPSERTRWPQTALSERLGLSYPIIQAPMIGSSLAQLAAAVSHAGGLGSLASANLTEEQLASEVEAIRAATERSFQLNFFVHKPPRLDRARAAALFARFAPYRAELGLSDEPPSFALPPAFNASMLERVLALRPAAVSFHFGLPEAAHVAALKQAGSFVSSSATSVAEARWLEQQGVDAIIAQGAEAGGHRGVFAEPVTQLELGLFALLPQVVDAVRVPVIAAGGIVDGRGIAAAFALGASAVQLGTAFLTTSESAIDPLYRSTLAAAGVKDTRITTVFTGRPARAIVTRFIVEQAELEGQALEFPLQRALTTPLARASAAQQSPDFHIMWSGQNASQPRVMPAAELVRTLIAETERAWR
jgi:nitronate monooxygenase